MVKSGLHRCGLTGELPALVCLSLCRWDAPDGFEQAVVVEPGHRQCTAGESVVAPSCAAKDGGPGRSPS